MDTPKPDAPPAVPPRAEAARRPEIARVARATGLSEPAVAALFDALVRGNGSMAQFNHPDLGGLDQWMRGGMVMVGDMFNTALAGKVSRACEELAPLAAAAAREPGKAGPDHSPPPPAGGPPSWARRPPPAARTTSATPTSPGTTAWPSSTLARLASTTPRGTPSAASASNRAPRWP